MIRYDSRRLINISMEGLVISIMVYFYLLHGIAISSKRFIVLKEINSCEIISVTFNNLFLKFSVKIKENMNKFKTVNKL